MDYRGGDRGIGNYGAEYIKAIKEGRTQSQQDRNLREKIIMGAIQAHLAAGRGIIGHVQQNEQQAQQKQEAMAEYAKSPIPNYHPMAAEATDAKLPAWLHGGQGDRSEMAMDNSVVDSLRRDPATNPNPYDKDPMVTRAEDAILSNPDEEPKVTWGNGRGMMGSQ
jgi:hypothetical protein